MIIEKETDIEILSGEVLKKFEEMQTGELKVVFLENYLKKLSYHDEMKRKVSKGSASSITSKEVLYRQENDLDKNN